MTTPETAPIVETSGALSPALASVDQWNVSVKVANSSAHQPPKISYNQSNKFKQLDAQGPARFESVY